MKKKIIYAITKSNWGGAQRYVYDLARNLPDDKYEVLVIGGGNGPLFEKLREKHIGVWKIPHLGNNFNIIKDILSFMDLLKTFVREEPDIIHLNSTKIGILGSLAAFSYKLLTSNFSPLTVFTVHGWAFNEERGWLAQKIIFALSRISSVFQDRIITICQNDFKSALKFIPERKLRIIPNGIEETPFLPREDCLSYFSSRIGYKGQLNETIVGTISELSPNKGLKYLITGFNLVKKRNPGLKAKLFIIGQGEQKTGLENKIKETDFPDAIHLLGFIPETAKYLKGLDIFALASLKEGLPYALMEAMAAGVACVATRVGGIPDLIENEKEGILVEPKNAEDLAKAIENLIMDSEKRTEFAQNAQEKIKNFGFAKMFERTVNIYA